MAQYQLELHAAYAIGNHWQTSVMYSRGNRNNSEAAIFNPDDNSEIIGTYFHRNLREVFQLGVGYFSSRKKNRILEMSGGLNYGFGTTVNEREYTNGTANSTKTIDYVRPQYAMFLQPSIGKNKAHFGWNFATKLIAGGNIDQSNNFFIISPTYSANFGWEKLRFETQFGFRIPSDNNMNLRILNLAGGMSYRIDL